MNERIRLLAEQATELDYTTFDSYNHKTVEHYKFNREKFAELLIRECVTKMALEIMDEQWVDDAVKNTYTHFGVEE